MESVIDQKNNEKKNPLRADLGLKRCNPTECVRLCVLFVRR